MKYLSRFRILGMFLLLSLIGMGILNVWENVRVRDLEREAKKLNSEIAQLTSRKERIEKRQAELHIQTTDLLQQKTQLAANIELVSKKLYDLGREQPAEPRRTTPKSERYLKITAPKGGEKLCLGHEYVIEWQSKGIQKLEIALSGGVGGSSYMEFGYPANLNETGQPGTGVYIWKVGKVGEIDGKDLIVPPGDGYSIRLSSFDGAAEASEGVGDKSNPFTVMSCE